MRRDLVGAGSQRDLVPCLLVYLAARGHQGSVALVNLLFVSIAVDFILVSKLQLPDYEQPGRAGSDEKKEEAGGGKISPGKSRLWADILHYAGDLEGGVVVHHVHQSGEQHDAGHARQHGIEPVPWYDHDAANVGSECGDASSACVGLRGGEQQNSIKSWGGGKK